MAKELSSKSVTFVKGGKTKMFGKQHAGPKTPGLGGPTKSGDGGKFASGGKGKMFGFRPSKPAVAGRSGQES